MQPAAQPARPKKSLNVCSVVVCGVVLMHDSHIGHPKPLPEFSCFTPIISTYLFHHLAYNQSCHGGLSKGVPMALRQLEQIDTRC